MKINFFIFLLLCPASESIAGPVASIDREAQSDTAAVVGISVDSLDQEVRGPYFHLTVGLAELFGLGIGYQVSDRWAVGVKYGGYWIGGGYFPSADGGFGIRVSQNTGWSTLNCISYEVVLFPNRITHRMTGGFAGEINIGHENIVDPGFHFIWSMGIAASFSANAPLVLPNLKAGVNFNL
ncbi:MAG TPA: hypothetical protein VIS48_04965 [Candidatus Kryptonia bacterium]